MRRFEFAACPAASEPQRRRNRHKTGMKSGSGAAGFCGAKGDTSFAILVLEPAEVDALFLRRPKHIPIAPHLGSRGDFPRRRWPIDLAQGGIYLLLLLRQADGVEVIAPGVRTEEVRIAFGHALINAQNAFEEATDGQQFIPLAGTAVPAELPRDGARA